MASVFLPNVYKELSDTLVTTKVSFSDKSVFKTYMDLMIFASMVGYSIGKNKTLKDFKDKGNEIPTSVFENNNMDSLVYLLSLFKEKDGNVLRDNRETDCWKIIEQYSSIGLNEVKNWFIENPGDTDHVDTLLNKMKIKAAEIIKSSDDIEVDNIEF